MVNKYGQTRSTKEDHKLKSIPYIPLPFKEVIADVLKVKPPDKKKPEKNK